MERKEVEKLGEQVAQKLGLGWETRIWNNLGWHVSWINGAVSVYYAEGYCAVVNGQKKPFWAMVGDPGTGSGHMNLTPRAIPHFRTAREAARSACKFAMQQIQKEWKPIESSVARVLLQVS